MMVKEVCCDTSIKVFYICFICQVVNHKVYSVASC